MSFLSATFHLQYMNDDSITQLSCFSETEDVVKERILLSFLWVRYRLCRGELKLLHEVDLLALAVHEVIASMD
jgi:hypothetical protein